MKNTLFKLSILGFTAIVLSSTELSAQSFNQIKFGQSSVDCKLHETTEDTYWFDPFNDYYFEETVLSYSNRPLQGCLNSIDHELSEIFESGYQCEVTKVWGTGATPSKNGIRKKNVVNVFGRPGTGKILFSNTQDCLYAAHQQLIQQKMQSQSVYPIGRTGPFQKRRTIPFFVEGVEVVWYQKDSIVFQASIEKNVSNSGADALRIWEFPGFEQVELGPISEN